MSMLALGLLFGAVTLLIMFSGAPIAFALGSVAVLFMYFFMPGPRALLPSCCLRARQPWYAST